MRMQLRQTINGLLLLGAACGPPSAGVTFADGGFNAGGGGSTGGSSADDGGDDGVDDGDSGAGDTSTGGGVQDDSGSSGGDTTAGPLPGDDGASESTGEQSPPPPVTVVDWEFGTSTYSIDEFAPRNITAVWILDAQGGYVTTLQMRGIDENVHLVDWHAIYDPNAHPIDAITGATSDNHGSTHVGSWDLTNSQGNVVPDGDYSLEFEFTEENSNSKNWPAGPRWSVPFTLGNGHFTLAPAGDQFFHGLLVDGHD